MEAFKLPEPFRARYVSIQYMLDGEPHGEEYVAVRSAGEFVVNDAIEFIEIDRATGTKVKHLEVYTTS